MMTRYYPNTSLPLAYSYQQEAVLPTETTVDFWSSPDNLMKKSRTKRVALETKKLIYLLTDATSITIKQISHCLLEFFNSPVKTAQLSQKLVNVILNKYEKENANEEPRESYLLEAFEDLNSAFENIKTPEAQEVAKKIQQMLLHTHWSAFSENQMDPKRSSETIVKTRKLLHLLETASSVTVKNVAEMILKFLNSSGDATQLARKLTYDIRKNDSQGIAFLRTFKELKAAFSKHNAPEAAASASKIQELLRQIRRFKKHPEEIQPSLPMDILQGKKELHPLIYLTNKSYSESKNDPIISKIIQNISEQGWLEIDFYSKYRQAKIPITMFEHFYASEEDIIKIAAASKIKYLRCYNLPLNGGTPKYIINSLMVHENLEHLQLLDLGRCNSKGFSFIGNMNNLKSLIIRSCWIDDKIISQLRHLQELKELHLIGTAQVSEQGASYIAQLRNLEHLKIEYIRAIQLKQLVELPKLKILDLRGYFIRSEDFIYIRQMKNLKKLIIDPCNHPYNQALPCDVYDSIVKWANDNNIEIKLLTPDPYYW